MDVFGKLSSYDYGEVHFSLDKATRLRAIVAIHDSRLGPALGGCRFLPYDTDEDALIDALRLARGMTYKAALAGLAHGGGKSVLIRPKQHFDRVALFRAFGRFVDDLGGHYITAEDSGTGLEDMEIIRTVTKHVTGVDPSHGGSGDPSPFTALGVRRGIEACVKFKLGKSDLKGVHVAVQGVGHVGYHLCKELHAAGAKLSVADVDPLKAERAQREFGAAIVDARQDLRDVECDVFAPCALGSGSTTTTDPAPARRRSSRAPRTTSSRSRATATTSTRAASSTRPTTRSTRAASSTSRRRCIGYDAEGVARADAQDLRHDLRDRRPQRRSSTRRRTRSPT